MSQELLRSVENSVKGLESPPNQLSPSRAAWRRVGLPLGDTILVSLSPLLLEKKGEIQEDLGSA